MSLKDSVQEDLVVKAGDEKITAKVAHYQNIFRSAGSEKGRSWDLVKSRELKEFEKKLQENNATLREVKVAAQMINWAYADPKALNKIKEIMTAYTNSKSPKSFDRFIEQMDDLALKGRKIGKQKESLEGMRSAFYKEALGKIRESGLSNEAKKIWMTKAKEASNAVVEKILQDPKLQQSEIAQQKAFDSAKAEFNKKLALGAKEDKLLAPGYAMIGELIIRTKTSETPEPQHPKIYKDYWHEMEIRVVKVFSPERMPDFQAKGYGKTRDEVITQKVEGEKAKLEAVCNLSCDIAKMEEKFKKDPNKKKSVFSRIVKEKENIDHEVFPALMRILETRLKDKKQSPEIIYRGMRAAMEVAAKREDISPACKKEISQMIAKHDATFTKVLGVEMGRPRADATIEQPAQNSGRRLR